MIYIGSDHGGYKLKEIFKEWLDNNGIEYTDIGTFSEESCDYPDIAEQVAQKVANTEGKGILICGTGIGMSIAANKIHTIRAALCFDKYTAEMSRMHNDSNILCIGGRTTDKATALLILKTWLDTPFEGGRHKRRVDKMMGLEK